MKRIDRRRMDELKEEIEMQMFGLQAEKYF